MKFVDAMKHMLAGKKISNPYFVISKYIYINKDNKIVNQLGYSISIDTNNDEWELYNERNK